MPDPTLHDALNRLERAVATAETALATHVVSGRAHTARKDAAIRDAVEELYGLIAALGGGRNG